MRIVGGKFKGKPLASPSGDTTRPTQGSTREALFNILMQGDPSGGLLAQRGHVRPPLYGAIVLDGFAGTGALGLEALSRGAAQAFFIEQDKDAFGVLSRNIDTLGVQSATRCYQTSCLTPPPTDRAATLIFLDPPYHHHMIPPALEALSKAGWITAQTLIVAEMMKKEPLQSNDIAGFSVCSARHYGKSKLVFLLPA